MKKQFSTGLHKCCERARQLDIQRLLFSGANCAISQISQLKC